MARSRKKKSDTVKVNFKDVESRQTPPEGDYKVTILEAKAGVSNNKNDQIEFTLEISEGKYKGTKLWFQCPLLENSLWKLHAFLTALGVDVPQDEMDIDLSELVGEECVAVVTHETYNGRKRAKMTDFDTLENYDGGDDDEDDDDEDEEDTKSKKSKKSKSKKSSKSKSKKSKKDDDDDDEDDEDDDDEDEEDTKSKKSKKADKKAKGKKKPKKYSEDDIEEMDEDELQEIIDEHDLDVDLDDFKKIGKKQAAVIDALEDEDLIED